LSDSVLAVAGRDSASRAQGVGDDARELVLTRALLAVTALASSVALWRIAELGRELLLAGDVWGTLSEALFALAFTALAYGGLAYLVTRLGYLDRLRQTAAGRVAEDAYADEELPPLAVLVPSYKEEPSVVRRTLLSAALQRVPHRRVVLLIDDPPNPTTPDAISDLAAMRALPAALQRELDVPANRYEKALGEFETRRKSGCGDAHAEAAALALHWRDAAAWLGAEIARYATADHADRLLVDRVLEPCRRAHLERARELDRIGAGEGIPPKAALCEYRRLAALFRVEIASFERKRYENLSHEPNKAMNLNSYLALMGGTYREVKCAWGAGTLLRKSPRTLGALHFPDAPLVLTLDADSVLDPGYASRLARVMTSRGNERVAVAQTPYSAFPDAPGLLERIAGAQTDVQYRIHQGFTRYGATFWVGANALLRKAALEDIATTYVERGHPVVRYIQDRTPIEDTESSIDLVDRGWTLYNYPERLAWSATPPDFGALLIQRRRWANGGLVILPKALRYLFRGPRAWRKSAEAMLRVHYLASIALVNIAFLYVMFGPTERNMEIVAIPVSMLPFMVAYARDLVLCGYRWGDFLRVYALNLLLLPINLGGTLLSLRQAITGRKAPFGRTPKVTGRTAAPGGYVLVEYGVIAASAMLGVVHAVRGEFLAAGFGALYVAFGVYAMVRFVGLRASAEDLRLWLRSSRRRAVAAAPTRGAELSAAAANAMTLKRQRFQPIHDGRLIDRSRDARRALSADELSPTNVIAGGDAERSDAANAWHRNARKRNCARPTDRAGPTRRGRALRALGRFRAGGAGATRPAHVLALLGRSSLPTACEDHPRRTDELRRVHPSSPVAAVRLRAWSRDLEQQLLRAGRSGDSQRACRALRFPLHAARVRRSTGVLRRAAVCLHAVLG